MFDFKKIVDTILDEQITDTSGNPISSGTDIAGQIDDAMAKWQLRIKQDISTTIYANNETLIWNQYIINEGKLFKGKPDANIQKRALDSITAKYVDMGFQIFQILRKEQIMDENSIKKIQGFAASASQQYPFDQILENTRNQNILNLIKSFDTPLDSYQCKSPWLKTIVDADNIAVVALTNFYGQTIYGAIKKMVELRAGYLKAQINEKNMLSVLTNPGAARSGNIEYSETFVNTLANNQMYIERIAAVGVAAKEYFKYLVNKKANLSQTQTTQEESSLKFTSLVKNIISEQNNQQVLREIPRDIWNPEKWNQEDPNFKKFETEYVQFLTNGTSQYIPGKEEIEATSQELETKVQQQTGQPFPPTEERPTEYKEPLVYTLSVISQDPSTQAKLLMKALEAIVQYTKIRKTLAARGLAQAAWDFTGQSLYPS
jgi:hypothetical protein